MTIYKERNMMINIELVCENGKHIMNCNYTYIQPISSIYAFLLVKQPENGFLRTNRANTSFRERQKCNSIMANLSFWKYMQEMWAGRMKMAKLI